MNKIKNGQIPANPPLVVNGSVEVTKEGLQLDGTTGSINAGDFNGETSNTNKSFYLLI